MLSFIRRSRRRFTVLVGAAALSLVSSTAHADEETLFGDLGTTIGVVAGTPGIAMSMVGSVALIGTSRQVGAGDAGRAWPVTSYVAGGLNVTSAIVYTSLMVEVDAPLGTSVGNVFGAIALTNAAFGVTNIALGAVSRLDDGDGDREDAPVTVVVTPIVSPTSSGLALSGTF